jgi:hypothetical protein
MLGTPVAQRSHDSPTWRVFGAALGACAVVLQLVVSAWLVVDAAAAANPADPSAGLAVICTHNAAGTADDSGAPPAPHRHGQCDACACPQSVKLLAPLPKPPILVVLRPRAQSPDVAPPRAAPQPRCPAPYGSRAPPFSA